MEFLRSSEFSVLRLDYSPAASLRSLAFNQWKCPKCVKFCVLELLCCGRVPILGQSTESILESCQRPYQSCQARAFLRVSTKTVSIHNEDLQKFFKTSSQKVGKNAVIANQCRQLHYSHLFPMAKCHHASPVVTPPIQASFLSGCHFRASWR